MSLPPRLLPAALALLLIAAAPAAAVPPPPKDVVFVSTLHQALEDDDEDVLATLVAPGAKFHVSGHQRETQSLTEFRKTVQEVYENLDDPKRRYTHIFSNTMGQAAVNYRLAGSYDDGSKPKPIDVDVVEHLRMEGGRLAELWYHFNYMMFSSQLGLKLTPPKGTR